MTTPPAQVALVVELYEPDIMLVSRLGVQQFAEKVLTDHGEYHHDITEIIHVFEHHAGRPGFLRSFHELPAVIHGHRGGNLDAGVFARFHGGYRYGRVPFPGSGGDDRVEVVAVAEAFEIARPAGIPFRAFAALVRHVLQGAFQVDGVYVADGGDFHSRNVEEGFYDSGPAVAHADHTHPNHFLLLGLRLDRAQGGGSQRHGAARFDEIAAVHVVRHSFLPLSRNSVGSLYATAFSISVMACTSSFTGLFPFPAAFAMDSISEPTTP